MAGILSAGACSLSFPGTRDSREPGVKNLQQKGYSWDNILLEVQVLIQALLKEASFLGTLQVKPPHIEF